MNNFIPLSSPDIREADIDAVIAVLRTGNLVQGKQVENFEKKLADYLGVPYCVAVTNGTATLHLILVALGIGPGDEVIIPALSYIATANVVELLGAKPVFVDIELDTFNINADLVASKISRNTKAVMVVHEFGLTADIHAIKELCVQHDFYFIEDAACALGSKEHFTFAGTQGIAGSFSFHPRKAITSGEGGTIVTSNWQLALRLRTLRNHGIDAANTSKMDFIAAGYNCRMTDFQGALLASQLDRLDTILARKREIAGRYLHEIKHPYIKLPTVPDNKLPSWQTFHVVLRGPLQQADTITKLREAGIGTNYGAQCMPDQTYFKQKYSHDSATEFPNAFIAYKQGMAIPIYEKLTNEQVTYIINTVNSL